MKKITYCLLLIGLSFSSYAQKFTVPDRILKRVVSREFTYQDTKTFKYKIVYPKTYDASKMYKVFLGLSGGNANAQIVNYCFYTVFDSKYLENYITILPVGPLGKPLTELSSDAIHQLIAEIQKVENVTNTQWLLAGTSMGGLAAYNFATASPKLFDGIITFPGGLGDNKVSEHWKNYNILLAGGELDTADWIQLNNTTKSTLEGHVKHVEVFTIEGQGHIISPDYDIDTVYSRYFNLNN